MNTNALKKFAQATRRKLLEQVNAKLNYVLAADTATLRTKESILQQLRADERKLGRQYLVDKVAYTWFNRLLALRFMDCNDYQPLGLAVISPVNGQASPQILQEAMGGMVHDELPVNRQLLFDILDNRTQSDNPENDAFKLLLIAACNHLHKVFPFLFERIDDYTELLLPDDLTSQFSMVHDVVQGIAAEDCQEVEIIGWLYQFYISERKDEVFASKSKVAKEDIPAATQLFTPRWIVEYMVQNTLGKLWLQNRPNSGLRQHMPYFIESDSLKADDYLKVNSVEEIHFLDQACGSGHILVYAFELFYHIYEEEGYSPNEIPALILQNNLYGFEIDQRAAQLAGMSLMMKARSKQRRFFRKEAEPRILCFEDLELDESALQQAFLDIDFELIDPKLWETRFYLGEPTFEKCLHHFGLQLADDYRKKLSQKRKNELIGHRQLPFFTLEDLISKSNSKASNLSSQLKLVLIPLSQDEPKAPNLNELEILGEFKTYASPFLKDCRLIQQATNLGSLIQPQTSAETLNSKLETLDQKLKTAGLTDQNVLLKLKTALEQLKLLANKFHCVVDNPPYMGGGAMNTSLATYVKKHYPDSKADLMACFMEAGLAALHPKGYLGMINQHSWMFLSSYEGLRKKLIENIFFDTNLHLGPRTFPEIGGEVVQNAAFTFYNTKAIGQGVYLRLVDEKSTELKRTKTLEAIQNFECGWLYQVGQKDFQKISGCPVGYWHKESTYKIFSDYIELDTFLDVRQGLRTGNNDQFLFQWSEVEYSQLALNSNSEKELLESKLKFVPHHKGGTYRKWYGNNEIVFKFNSNTIPVLKGMGNKLPSRDFYFKDSITWTGITGGKLSFRLNGTGFTFDGTGSCAFGERDKLLLSGALLQSSVGKHLLGILSPTISLEVGHLKKFPLKIKKVNEEIKKHVVAQIDLSKQDWNSRETSWDFTQNELLRQNTEDLEEAYALYCQYWQNKFYQLHQNEEILNQEFIKIYGLQGELTPDVPLNEITILQDELDSKALKALGERFSSGWCLVEGEWTVDWEQVAARRPPLPFNKKEIITQLLSYSVGCMFGRYSLDAPGHFLANQGEGISDYIAKVQSLKSNVQGLSDLKFAPDEDNVIPLLDDDWFEDDVQGQFYAFLRAAFGEQNFQSNLAFVEDALGMSVRKFFLTAFYKDHIKRYKKRPIYWQFSSPKGYFNVLIYMHRYSQDTLNTVLNGYLRPFIDKINFQIARQQEIETNGSPSEQTAARRKIDELSKMLKDAKEYERDILSPIAAERIPIDLDDGVLVNYNKFGTAIKEVPGLNDKKAKAKVKKFDWIDGKMIK